MGFKFDMFKFNLRIMRYDIKYNLRDNIKIKVKHIRTNVTKYARKTMAYFNKSSSSFEPPRVKIEPMEVIWYEQGKWKWAIEETCNPEDDYNTFDEEWDDDYNPFGEEWDDDCL